MDGKDVARRGREFHVQMRGGDDGTEGVERGTAKEDIVGCGRVNIRDTDGNGFSLGSITKHDVKVNVAAGGNLFVREAIDWFVIWDHGSVWELEFLICGPVEDVDRAALVMTKNKFQLHYSFSEFLDFDLFCNFEYFKSTLLMTKNKFQLH